MKHQYETHPRDPYTLNIHKLAKSMVADGYFGQNLLYPDKSERYILAAAMDPAVESKLPPTGFTFWERCDFAYRVWKTRRQFNRSVAPRAPSPATAGQHAKAGPDEQEE
jgi:hypothetical protein